jgi:iron complex outermembrane receptor protein
MIHKEHFLFIFFFFFIFFHFAGRIEAQNVEKSKLTDTIFLASVDVSATLIEGELKNIPGSITVLTNTQLSAYSDFSLTEQLNSVPGITMHSGTFNTNRIVIRGIGSRTPYSTNRIRAYLNDIPLTDGNGVTLLEDIDASRLGRAEVIKGPSSALYGSGLGGTIKLSTAQLDEHVMTSFTYGSYNTRKLNVAAGLGYKDGHASASFHCTRSDGFRQNNNYGRNSAYFTADKQIKQTHIGLTVVLSELEAQIPSSIDRDTYDYEPYRAAGNWLAVEGHENQQRMLAGLSVRQRLSPYFSNNATLFVGYRNEFELRPFNHLKEQSVSYGIRNQLHFQKNNIGAVGGIELYAENLNWRTFIPEENAETTVNDIDETRAFGNIFGMLNYQASSRLLLTGGLNVNRLNFQYRGLLNDAGVFSFPVIVSPRVGANYALSANTNLYASVGHGFSSPSLEETLLPEGDKNPDIKPEQGWMFENGIRFSGFDSRLFIDAVAYHIAIKNLLVTKRISEEVFTGINAGRSKHSGVEMQAGYVLFSGASFPGQLNMNASLNFSRNVFVEFIDDGIDHSGNFLPGIPSSAFIFGLDWLPFDGFHLYFNTRVSGSQYLTDANDLDVEGYSVSNLKISHKLKVSGDFSISMNGGINNIFDVDYVSMILPNAPGFGTTPRRYYYPGQPRNMYVGIRFSF